MSSAVPRNPYLNDPPALPKRQPNAVGIAEDVEPYNLAPQPAANVAEDAAPPPLPERQQAPITVTEPTTRAAVGNAGADLSSSSPAFVEAPRGNYPDRLPNPRQQSTGARSISGASAKSESTVHTIHSAKNKEEVSFQFDRHVQEIRRRRTVPKSVRPPERDEFTRIEAESGKRVLDVSQYIQAYWTYFVESLAREDKVRKMEPLQLKKMKGLVSRLYDTTTPVQSLGFYLQRVMYWTNPAETLAWFTVYFALWSYNLWVSGLISLVVIKMLNNRYGFLGSYKEQLDVPGPLTDNIKNKESMRGSKMDTQLKELIHSKDLTEWVSLMNKFWGPYSQVMLEETVGYLERARNLFRWERPMQSWLVLIMMCQGIVFLPLVQSMAIPGIGFFLGVEFFILLPLQHYYPRFSHVFSPLELLLWDVPTNAELAVEMMTRQQDGERRVAEENEAGMPGAVDTANGSRAEGDSAALMSGGTPASNVKQEYQSRMGARSSSRSSSMTESLYPDTMQEKSEFHCLFHGKPGRLVITEDALMFRSAKLLGRDIQAQIKWEDIDTIKKSKSMNLGIWSMPGIDVKDINGRLLAFHNVVHRDQAFRNLVVTSGKKWSHVA
ncbi:hypothetical protein BC939DRAFT_437025 [Gamsiella multidivaricata]|uniref:uncharacterized protein n=1 Tax=Gamsiella multidivaricata TaxID=101098 RepID=UPI002220E3D4|nr:uncharacterized protein BC939DRAFT_437025 [Gamsiella multidivaricata]KAG0365919.1 hypothetical protein BGZ54_006047 [Gamsiella multidivaricata]KAI7831444.1 hypothetical protein BC939DRAFT_437025 [Gamsiella multidivaricata]